MTAPEFTQKELQYMHRYCRKYRDFVRGGGKPNKERTEKYKAFQRVLWFEELAGAGL